MKRTLVLAFAFGLALAACGSSDQKDLFGGGSGGVSGSTGGSTSSGGSAGSVSSGGSAGAATGGSSGSAGGSGGSAASSGGSSGSSGVGGDAGGAGVAGVGGDAGTGGVSGTGGVGGAGGAGGSGGAPPGACTGHCGSQQPQQGPNGYCYCDAQCLQNNDCCADFAKSCGPAGAGEIGCFNGGVCKAAQGFCCMDYNDGACVSQFTSCYNDAAIHCDGPEDCAATQVCCGHLEQSGSSAYWTEFTCKSGAECALFSEIVICGSNPAVCLGGTVCKQSGSLPQIKYCGQP
jgi:hypothetical protein